MVQAGVGAFPTAPGFPGAGGAQTAGAAGAGGVGTVAAQASDGTGLSMVVKNAAAVAAAAAAQAAQDSQLQHQLKQQDAPGSQVSLGRRAAIEKEKTEQRGHAEWVARAWKLVASGF